MSSRTELFGTSAGEIRALRWGSPDKPLLLAVHGAFGVAENFREIADRLSDEFQVVALDLPGRGQSFWATAPEAEYRLSHLAALVAEIVDGLGAGTLAWLGTSMGGTLGVHAAAGVLGDRISHLVMNDIGPTLPAELTDSLRTGVAAQPLFASLGELADHLRLGLGELAGPPRDKSFWVARAEVFAKRLPDGQFTLHQDPRIACHFVEGREDFEVWKEFSHLSARAMVIHGCKSAVLTDDIVRRMRECRTDLTVVSYPDWGHAPFLDRAEDADVVRTFLHS